MVGRDAEVWSEFLKDPPFPIDRVEYDVKVGTIPEGVPLGTPEQVRSADGIYLKRIDVVAFGDDWVRVIEVKPFINHQAIGQAIAYRRLYGLKFGNEPEIKAAIVGAEVDKDMIEIAGELEIELWIPTK